MLVFEVGRLEVILANVAMETTTGFAATTSMAAKLAGLRPLI
jgi:hypothetical protein